MELLAVVKERINERKQIDKLLKEKFSLTTWQEKVLLRDKSLYIEPSNITMYEKQNRGAGTSTALLLKVIKNIFIDNVDNNVIVITSNQEQARYLQSTFVSMLEELSLCEHIKSKNKFNVRLNNNINIRFTNNNYDNLRGSHPGQEIFIDDFKYSEFNLLRTSNYLCPLMPSHIHIFQKGKDFSRFESIFV